MMEVDKKKTRTDEAWVRLYARFETDCLLPADAEHAPAMHRRLYLKWGSVAAAVIAGIVCFAAWWAVPEQGGDSRSLLTEENREKPTLVKTLEDGSVVYLAQESTLKYPEHFAEDKREVNLQGEAFFDVAKKPEQAFTIETARVRVEVLGTAFNVRSNEGAPFSLSVKRGKVKVLLKQEEQTVFVEAGETVILQGGSLLVSETENPELFDRYTSNIRFKDECLEDVLCAINKESAGWQIEAASPTLGKRRLTVEFSNNSPESVAELICWTFDLKCTRQGNRLILSEQ